MTIQMNVAEAKARLSALIEAALAGQDVILARDGEPVARIVPLAPPRKRRLGVLRDYGWTADVPPEVFEPEPDDVAWIERPLGGVEPE